MLLQKCSHLWLQVEKPTQSHTEIILWATDDQLVDEDLVSFRALEEQIPSFLIEIKIFFYYLCYNFYKCATLTKKLHSP